MFNSGRDTYTTAAVCFLLTTASQSRISFRREKRQTLASFGSPMSPLPLQLEPWVLSLDNCNFYAAKTVKLIFV